MKFSGYTVIVLFFSLPKEIQDIIFSSFTCQQPVATLVNFLMIENMTEVDCKLALFTRCKYLF